MTNPAKLEAKRLMLVMQDGNKKISSLLNQLKSLKAKTAVARSEERSLVCIVLEDLLATYDI